MSLTTKQRKWLVASFNDIAEALSLRTLGGAAPDALLDIYEEPARHYHNGQHLFHCIKELESGPRPYDPYVGLALWFHDVLYDPTRHDNEARCADLVGLYAPLLRLRPDSLLTIQRLILATDHRATPMSGDEALIIDIDLAILGQPANVFDAYEHAIRNEYAHVPDEAFGPARAEILRAFLARPAIYHTLRFRRQYESQARTNLTHSLEKLV